MLRAVPAALLGGKMLKKIIILSSIALVAGCAAAPPSFTPIVAQTIGRHQGSIGEVSVQSDPAGLQNGQIKMIFGADVIPLLWKNATESALAQSKVFDGTGERRFDVIVTIMMLKPPSEGLAINTPAKARYDVVDSKTRKIVYTIDVETVGRVAFGDSFSGAVRIRDSINRATQANIIEFINRLQAAKI
jgi:hypothetical protein